MDIVGLLSARDITAPTLRIVDIGAMALGVDPWEPLIAAGVAQVLGFEPQIEECTKLQADAGPGRRYLPYAIGDGRRWPFHRAAAPMTSSILPPNLKLARRFQTLAELMQVVETTEVETRRLDDVPEARGADLLKLDVQGFELKILEHASEVLARALLVQVEVSFVELYEGQPLFADVDRHLRGQGFMLHALSGIGSRAYRPLLVNHDPSRGLNQLLWADAVYVRELDGWTGLAPDDLLRLFLLLHAVYGSADLAHVALESYDRAAGDRLAPAYLAGLTRRRSAA